MKNQSIKTVADLKKELRRIGIKTYRNKKTQASYVKKADIKKLENALAESEHEGRAKSIGEEVAKIIKGKVEEVKSHGSDSYTAIVQRDEDIMIEVNYNYSGDDWSGEIRVIFGEVGAFMQGLKGLAKQTHLDLVVDDD